MGQPIPDALRGIYHEFVRLQKRVKELEHQILEQNSCVVCSGLLIPSETPPHCEDCHPDEDQEIAWARKVRKWDEELEKRL